MERLGSSTFYLRRRHKKKKKKKKKKNIFKTEKIRYIINGGRYSVISGRQYSRSSVNKVSVFKAIAKTTDSNFVVYTTDP